MAAAIFVIGHPCKSYVGVPASKTVPCLKMRKKSRRRALGSNPAFCYLCGLCIPLEIVSSRHPLFGTVDHVVARSRNGSNGIHNRLPAHRLCNLEKGSHLIRPEEFALAMRHRVLPLLESLGHRITQRMKGKALQRVRDGWPAWAPIRTWEDRRAQFDRWEDDGGSVTGYYGWPNVK